MNVILLTVFVGLILVGLAIVFFFYARASSFESSPERDSLMPLQDETRVAHRSDRQTGPWDDARIRPEPPPRHS